LNWDLNNKASQFKLRGGYLLHRRRLMPGFLPRIHACYIACFVMQMSELAEEMDLSQAALECMKQVVGQGW